MRVGDGDGGQKTRETRDDERACNNKKHAATTTTTTASLQLSEHEPSWRSERDTRRACEKRERERERERIQRKASRVVSKICACMLRRIVKSEASLSLGCMVPILQTVVSSSRLSFPPYHVVRACKQASKQASKQGSSKSLAARSLNARCWLAGTHGKFVNTGGAAQLRLQQL